MSRAEGTPTADGDATRFEVMLLGPLEVVASGNPVVVAGARRRAVLARLALDPSRPISADRLVDDLFEDDPHHRSIATLRTYITKLRQQLPGGARLLVSEPGGYALRLPRSAVDLFAFEDAVAGVDEPELLARELARWRGTALQEFAHVGWARADAVRADELRLQVQERLIVAEMARGRHTTVVPSLQALVGANPLRESLHVQLAVALYRSGRQADALAAQRQAVDLLRSELGLEPGPELAALELRILEHDPTLLAATVASTPRQRVAVQPATRVPAALQRRATDVPTIGRGEELRRLHSVIDGAAADRARLVVIDGESGMGKTRLAAELAAARAQTGWTVLFGHCDEHLRVAYQPFVEALRDYGRRRSSDAMSPPLGDDVAALASLAPDVLPARAPAAIVSSDDSAADQLRLFDAICSWLRAVSAETPLLFVLDDLHWATSSTAMLLRHATRSLARHPVVFLATMRRNEPGVDDLLTGAIADLIRDGAVDVLSLDGLGDDDAAALFRAHAGAHDGSMPELVGTTGGNPYLISEIGRDAAARESGSVPVAARSVLLARVGRLSPTTQQLLQLASIVGVQFDIETLIAGSGSPDDDILNELDEAVSVGLVREIDGALGTYAFAHAILRRAIVESLTASRRVLLHGRVAQGLEAVRDREPHRRVRAEEIALHWRESGPRHARRAAQHFVAAGRIAAAQFAYDDARRHLEDALACQVPPERTRWRADVLLALADVRARLGDATASRALLAEAAGIARATDDAELLAGVALGTSVGGRGVSTWLADDVRASMLDEAAASLPAGAVELRVRVGGELALALWRPHEHERRQLVAREAVELAEQSGEPSVVAAALPASRVRFWRTEDADRRLAFATAVASAARERGDVWEEVEALVYARGDHQEIGDRDGFDAAGDRLRQIAAAVGGTRLTWRAHVCDAHDLVLAGRLDDAAAAAAAALQAWGEDPAPDAVQTYGYQMMVVNGAGGRFDEMLRITSLAGELLPDLVAMRAAHALSLAGVGRHPESEQIVRECVAGDFATVTRDSLHMITLVSLAEAAIANTDLAAAAALHEVLREDTARLVGVAGPGIVWGSVASAVGRLASRLGRRDEAVEHLEQACAIERRFGALPWLSRSERALEAVRSNAS